MKHEKNVIDQCIDSKNIPFFNKKTQLNLEFNFKKMRVSKTVFVRFNEHAINFERNYQFEHKNNKQIETKKEYYFV